MSPARDGRNADEEYREACCDPGVVISWVGACLSIDPLQAVLFFSLKNSMEKNMVPADLGYNRNQ